MRATAVGTLTLITLSALAGCSDSNSVTGPATPAGRAANTVVLGSPATVNVVTRDTPLSAPQSASAFIGVFGGRISLPGAGLTVYIPPFALETPTVITVTAVAGNQVAYEFEPHGTQFRVPLIASQNLTGTSASTGGVLPSVLYAGYFANVADLNQLNATALVSELLGTSISSSGRASFLIGHFSGYLIAAGLADSGDGEGEGSQ
jgi:hypothetical protein